jgi:hypothetical protein
VLRLLRNPILPESRLRPCNAPAARPSAGWQFAS